MNRTRTTAAGLALAALLLAGCGQERVNEAEIGVHYTDGMIEGQHFDHIIEPGGSQFVINDHVYKLPARQITWITGPGDEADAPSLTFTAAGGEAMTLELTTRMVLNTTLDKNDDPFKTFFTGICQKFDCWEGAVNGNDPQDGWNRMLRETVGNSQNAAAKRLGLDYDANALRYNIDGAREDFADAFATEFERLLADEVDVSDIFCGPGYKRGEEECPPVSVNVVNVTFVDPAREAIQEQRRLAQEQINLATDQRAAADAQQLVNSATATPDYVRLHQTQAMEACAANPECSLTFVISDEDIQPTVPVG